MGSKSWSRQKFWAIQFASFRKWIYIPIAGFGKHLEKKIEIKTVPSKRLRRKSELNLFHVNLLQIGVIWCDFLWYWFERWKHFSKTKVLSYHRQSLFILKATCFWWFIRRTHATFSAKFPTGGWGFTNDVIQCWTKVEAVLKSEISKRCLGLLNKF